MTTVNVEDNITQVTVVDDNITVEVTRGLIGPCPNIFDDLVTFKGGIKVGDGTTNYTRLDAEGVLGLHGTARTYRHLDVLLSMMKKGVGNPPAEGIINGFPTLDFDEGTEEETFCLFFGPMDWAPGTGATLCVDFFVDTAPAIPKNVVWGIEYKSIAADGILDFSSGTVTDTDTVAIVTGSPAHDKQLHQTEMTIAPDGLILDGLLLVRMFRDATNMADTFVGDARMIKVRICYVKSTLGGAT